MREFIVVPAIRFSVSALVVGFVMLAEVTLAQIGIPGAGDEGAADPWSDLDPELASPRAALTTFLKAIEAAQGSKDQQQWKKVYKTLEIPKSAGEARRDAALRLKQVLNRIGNMTPEMVAPDAAEVSEGRLERFELFPENSHAGASDLFHFSVGAASSDPPGKLILSRDPDIGWRFNSESIESINPLFGWLEEVGVVSLEEEKETLLSDEIRSRVPQWAKRGFFLGMEVWQWLVITLSLLVSVADFWLGSVVCSSIISLACRKFSKAPTSEDKRRVARPLALILGALSFIWMLKLTGVIGISLAVFLLAGRLVLAAGITWTAWSLVNFMMGVWERYTRSTETTFDDMLVPLVRKTLKLIVIVWAIIYVAESIDVLNFVTPLLAGFGLAGLAISFAAQDLIKNLFGGVTIFLDGPFQVGERIIFEGYDGVVEAIGFRSTRLRTQEGHLVTVPNGAITSHCVENIGRRPSIRKDFRLGLTYDTSPKKIREAKAAILEILEEPGIEDQIHPQEEGKEFPPRVYFEEFSGSALILRVIYWYAGSDYWSYMEHANEVNLRIAEVFAEKGIKFAFPTKAVDVVRSAGGE